MSVPVSKMPQYEGSLYNNIPHGEGRLITSEYTYTGSFDHGVKHGQGIYTYRDGTRFSTQLYHGEMYGTSTYTDRDKKEYLCHLIDGVEKALLMWKDNNNAYIGKWSKKERVVFYYGTLINPPFVPSNAIGYSFKPGTCALDCVNDPGPNRDLLEKIGFVFFKLDEERLRKSSADVQEALLVGLLSRNFWVSETSHLRYAVESLPGYTSSRMHYFFMVEKRTGTIAGAIYAKSKGKDIEFDSVTINERFRGEGIGALFLTTTIRRLQQDMGSSNFTLEASNESLTWYPKYGFSKITKDPDCRYFALSLINKTQKRIFAEQEQAVLSKIRSNRQEPFRTVRKIITVVRNVLEQAKQLFFFA